ncbi:MAG TPA: hypothetical protein VL856_05455, partial [Acidimicrobiia bacterium]|nr:hypothetical protein [Acidimicrobiia bacterium]
LLAAGCSVPDVDYSTKSCPCPAGWMCGPANLCVREGTAADANPFDANCTVDTDNDGKNDCTDNCPAVMNAQQFDEDGDGRGDACDLCPGDFDDGANSDGDGVGDACDPDPTSKQRIALFEGFHAGVPATWTVTGNWAKVGDDIAVTSGNDVISNLAIVDPEPSRQSWLFGKMTVGELFDPGASTRYAGLVRRWNQTPDDNVRCLVFQQVIGGATSLGIRDTGVTPALVVLVPHPFAQGQTERFVFEQNGTSYRCASGTTMVTGMTTVSSANAKIGLRTRSASASYSWMMLVVPDP